MLHKPFLKWAGGKTRLVLRIKSILPEGKRLIEPFAGSAVIFLNTQYSHNIIADTNRDLIFLYQTLKKEGKSFIQYAKQFFTLENNTQIKYLEYRDEFNSTKDERLKSALFIYLNKHGFNGLCRYNLQNQFNVPFGLYHKPPVFPENEMLFFHEKSQTAEFIVSDYKETFRLAKTGDVIYCDPPYVPLSKTANFTSYSSNQFGLREQIELAKLANVCREAGIKVFISNHHTTYTEQLYSLAKISTFDVQRFISSVGNKREKVAELLAEF